MAKISAFIKKDYLDKKGEAIVVLHYFHDYKSLKINTGIKVNPSYLECIYDTDYEVWRFKSTRKLTDDEKSRLQSANEDLTKKFTKLSRAVQHLKSHDLSLNVDYVKQEFSKTEQKVIEVKSKTVLSWWEDFIKIKTKEVGAGLKPYKSTFAHFELFATDKGAIRFEDLTMKMMEEFRDYLLDLGLEASTVHKQFKNLRIFVNWVLAQDEEGQIRVPLAYKKIKVRARYGDPVGLTVDQFFEFCNANLAHRPFLEITRDVFLFGVSIGGPRHGDLQDLVDKIRKHGSLKNHNTLSYFESKTGNAHQEIILNRIGLDVMKKYNNHLPEVPSNFRMNQNLKSIAKLLNWNEIKLVPLYDSYGKLLEVQEIPLKEMFSTKFMRKTAATIDNYLNVPTKTSMKRTGHKTFAAYSRYVDVNRESMQQANGLWDNLAITKIQLDPEMDYTFKDIYMVLN